MDYPTTFAIELRYIAHETAEPIIRLMLLAIADAIDRHIEGSAG